MMLSREQLLAQKGRRYIEVPIELMDGTTTTARLQSLTVKERAKYLNSFWDQKTGKPVELEQLHVKLVTLTLVDADGKVILEPTDRLAMFGLDGGVIGELYESAVVHCRIGRKGVEEAAKNSSETDDDETSGE